MRITLTDDRGVQRDEVEVPEVLAEEMMRAVRDILHGTDY